MIAASPPDALVAFGGAGPRTRAALLRDAGRIAAALPAPTADSSVLIIARHDRYALAAALLGVWAAGHRAALPPDTRRDSIWRTQDQPGVVAMLHDTDAGHAHRLVELLAGDGGEPIAPPALDDARVIFYRADDDGALRPHDEAATTLVAEARAVVDRVGIEPGDRVASTVPPGHRLGLVASMLAPLLAGAAFARETVQVVDVLAAQITAHGVDTLVTAPAHLRALAPAWAAGGLAPLRQIVTTPTEAASTEAAPGVALITLPGPAPADHPLARALWAIDGVDDAAVCAVGDRLLVAVAAEPTVTLDALRAALPALPADVARVDAVPRDDVGALDRPRLLQRFGLDPQGRPFEWQLDWRAEAEAVDGDRHRRVFEAVVPPTYGWYTGHFPGYPILMGAVQLRELALRCARVARPGLGDVAAVHKIKFLERICPGDAITVAVEWRAEQPHVDFRITRGETICSAGRLVFAEAP